MDDREFVFYNETLKKLEKMQPLVPKFFGVEERDDESRIPRSEADQLAQSSLLSKTSHSRSLILVLWTLRWGPALLEKMPRLPFRCACTQPL